MSCGFVVDERYFWHDARDTGSGYVEAGVDMESPEPRRRLLNLIRRTGLDRELVSLAPRELAHEDLLRVHPAEYLERFKRLSDADGGSMGEYASFGPGSYEIASLAAGGVYAAMDAVLRGVVSTAYALVRPPGHHAEPDLGRGYCLLANIPLAVLKAREVHGVRRVAVIDWDVHHGNGTQKIFWDDPEVLAISIHQRELFPLDTGFVDETGGPDAPGATINIPLSAGAGFGAYGYAFEEVILPALEKFQPELIIVACGFDASAMDPMGRMLLTPRGFHDLTVMTMRAAADLCNGRLVFAHEGGYSPVAVPFSGINVLSALLGQVPDVELEEATYLDDLADQQLNDHHRHQIDQARDAVAQLRAPR